MVIKVPENETQKILNEMLKQSQRQHRYGIKAIIKTDKPKKTKDEQQPKKPKCICPVNISKTKKKKGKENTIQYRRKHTNGYVVAKCPVHS